MTTLPLSATALKPHLRPCTLYPNPISPPLRQSITITHCKSSRHDSNTAANEFQRRRSWWVDSNKTEKLEGGVLEEVVDSLWIVKIFRFYGWWLPPILISMLLATGPKAFLLALASTTGLSLSTLAFTKLLGLLDAPKPKSRARKNKKRTRGRATSNLEMDSQEEEEEEEEEEEYRSWVSYDDGMSDKGNREDSSDFRGWDEIAGDEVFSGRTRRRDVRGERRVRRERRFTRREMGGEMPLLLRLLIAVFPFLGSWTKML